MNIFYDFHTEISQKTFHFRKKLQVKRNIFKAICENYRKSLFCRPQIFSSVNCIIAYIKYLNQSMFESYQYSECLTEGFDHISLRASFIKSLTLKTFFLSIDNILTYPVKGGHFQTSLSR